MSRGGIAPGPERDSGPTLSVRRQTYRTAGHDTVVVRLTKAAVALAAPDPTPCRVEVSYHRHDGRMVLALWVRAEGGYKLRRDRWGGAEVRGRSLRLWLDALGVPDGRYVASYNPRYRGWTATVAQAAVRR